MGSLLAILIIHTRLIANWSGMIGIIWLILQGQWKLPLVAFVFSIFLSTHIATLLLLPSTLITMILAPFLEKIENNRWVTTIVLLITLPLTNGAVAFYDISIFNFGLNLSKTYDLIPVLLIAISLAVTPWQILASKEKDNIFTQISTVVNEIACVLCAILLYLNIISIANAFFVILLLLLIINTIYFVGINYDKKQSRIYEEY